MGICSENVFQSASKSIKEKIFGQNFFPDECFATVMNNQSANSGYLDISFLHSKHYSSVKTRRMKLLLITAAPEASCCCILVSGVMVEAEMCDTNNKHSVNLGDFKKALFKPLKIRHFVSKFKANEQIFI